MNYSWKHIAILLSFLLLGVASLPAAIVKPRPVVPVARATGFGVVPYGAEDAETKDASVKVAASSTDTGRGKCGSMDAHYHNSDNRCHDDLTDAPILPHGALLLVPAKEKAK